MNSFSKWLVDSTQEIGRTYCIASQRVSDRSCSTNILLMLDPLSTFIIARENLTWNVHWILTVTNNTTWGFVLFPFSSPIQTIKIQERRVEVLCSLCANKNIYLYMIVRQPSFTYISLQFQFSLKVQLKNKYKYKTVTRQKTGTLLKPYTVETQDNCYSLYRKTSDETNIYRWCFVKRSKQTNKQWNLNS